MLWYTLVLAELAVLFVLSPRFIFPGALIGAAMGAWLLWSILAGRRYMRFTLMLAAGLMVGFFGGMAVVCLSAGVGRISVRPEWIAYTLTMVCVGVIPLLAASALEGPIVSEDDAFWVSSRLEFMLWILAGLTGAAIASGNLAFSGAVEQGPTRDTVLGSLGASAATLLLPFAAMGFVQYSGFRRIRFFLIGFMGAAGCIMQGRRWLAYPILLSVFAVSQLSAVKLKLSAMRKALLFAVCIGLLFAASFVFTALRSAMLQSLGGLGSHSLGSIINAAEATSLTDPGGVIDQIRSNLSARPANLVHYLSLLSRAGNHPEPLYGQDALFAFRIATPDWLYTHLGGNKDVIREIESEEGLANEHFHIPIYDDANSVLSAGFIDFGWAGIVLYPLMLCAFYRLILNGAGFLPTEGRMLLIFGLLFELIQAENELSGYIKGARNIGILLVIWACCYAPALLKRHPQRCGLSC